MYKSPQSTLIRDLGNGLLLRRSVSSDSARLGEFAVSIFLNPDGSRNPGIAAWVDDLLNRRHPTFDPGDFTIVADTHTGAIVSTLNLIPVAWSYGGIPISVGQVELVATDPAYRNRGLVRAQFEVVHEWARQRGMQVLAITGIPYFYRQFGYEMCVDMEGGRVGFAGSLPLLLPHQAETLKIRRVEERDIPFLVELGQRARTRSLVAALYDETRWRYEALTKSRENCEKKEYCLLESSEGQALGVFNHALVLGPDYLDNNLISSTLLELKPGVAYPRALPAILRHLWQTGQQIAQRSGGSCERVGLLLGRNHPALSAARAYLPKTLEPYAFFIRVADLPGFLRTITPVLDANLSRSAFQGYTGEVKISFYRSGLRLVFNRGQLSEIAPWQPGPRDEGQAAFPGLTFLQLVFGYRSLEELEYAFPDCWADEDTRPFLDALFPKQPSEVWSMT